ncbi:hypothetical protein, partial [Pseudomonas syringae group genomosp. 3]|uniref:hypothetical protein n=1 Tax=Pseudomonas syringae group genomosp. 3 TaxID=251701 RepID=UPI001C8157B9
MLSLSVTRAIENGSRFFKLFSEGAHFSEGSNGNALCDAPRQILAAAQRHAWPAITAHKRKRFFITMA